jgi:hypothetical protein
MSNRGRTILRRLCKKVVTDSRIFGKGQRTLKTLVGSPVEKVAAVKRVETYLSLMKVGLVPHRNSPSELFQTVAALRKTASDRRMSSRVRVVAISKLMRIEGFAVEQYWEQDATDDFIQSLVPVVEIERELGSFSQRIRKGARTQALEDVTKMFESDRAHGCFKSLADVVLRLPEMPEPEKAEVPLLNEVHRDAVNRTLQMFRRNSGGDDVNL